MTDEDERADDVHFRALVEAAPDGVVVSRRGVVLFANAAALRLLGCQEPSDLVGRSMGEFLSPDDMRVMQERIMASRGGENLGPRTYRAKRKDGGEVAAEITSLPLPWEGGPAVIAFARDVTERARLEAELARAERLASVGTLATGLAHEINNPLAFALLSLDRLRRVATGEADEDGRRQVEGILSDVRGGLDRVAAIVRDLRAFARDGDGRSGSANLATVVGDVRRLVAHEVEPRARLAVEVGELPRVRGDALRIEQVLVNLIVNAAQSFARPAPENIIALSADGERSGRVVVTVRDNGEGMASDVLARAFDPFFTTKAGSGSGLGLWICHTIVEKLGGKLTLESRLGGGTTARLELASADDVDAILAAPRSERVSASTRRSVLVVDDEPALLRTVQALLSDRFQVEVATSGDQAIHRLTGDAPPDVVLCDVQMPGVSGVDVFTRVARERPGLEDRIVFMSGGSFLDDTVRFLASVPNRRIEKPFSISALEAALLEGPPSSRA